MKPALKFTCKKMQHKNMRSRSRFFRLSYFCDFFLAALLLALFDASHPAGGEQINQARRTRGRRRGSR